MPHRRSFANGRFRKTRSPPVGRIRPDDEACTAPLANTTPTTDADPERSVIALESGHPAACLLTFIQSRLDTSHNRRARRVERSGLTIRNVPTVSPFLVNEDAVAPAIYAVHLI